MNEWTTTTQDMGSRKDSSKGTHDQEIMNIFFPWEFDVGAS
jgi:hypothetical protein